MCGPDMAKVNAKLMKRFFEVQNGGLNFSTKDNIPNGRQQLEHNDVHDDRPMKKLLEKNAIRNDQIYVKNVERNPQSEVSLPNMTKLPGTSQIENNKVDCVKSGEEGIF